MKACKECKVLVDDSMDHCPLCWHKLEGETPEDKALYPEYKEALPIRSQLKRYKVLLFVSICTAVLVLLVNLLTWSGSLWSIYILASIGYAWLLVFHTIFKRQHIGIKILVQLIAISVLLVVIDLLSGATLWSTTYVIPLLIIGASIAIDITVLTQEMRWPDYTIYQIVVIFIGLIPLVFYLVGWATILWPNVAAGFVSFVLFLSLLIFKDKKFKQELKKRFHA